MVLEMVRPAEAPIPSDDVVDPAKAEADALWAELQMEKAPSPIDPAGTLISKQESFGTTDGTDQTLDVLQGIARDGVAQAGHFYIYDPRTGDRSVTNGNQLRQQLTKRDPFTGELMFTARDPGKRPPKGTHPCLLHPDHPDSARWLEMGLKPCTKRGYFRNEAEALLHCQRKHRSQWQIIEQLRQRDERAETREQAALLNRALTTLLERQAPPEPIPQAVIVRPENPQPPQEVVLPAAKPIVVRNKGGRPKGSRKARG